MPWAFLSGPFKAAEDSVCQRLWRNPSARGPRIKSSYSLCQAHSLADRPFEGIERGLGRPDLLVGFGPSEPARQRAANEQRLCVFVAPF